MLQDDEILNIGTQVIVAFKYTLCVHTEHWFIVVLYIMASQHAHKIDITQIKEMLYEPIDRLHDDDDDDETCFS